MVTAEDLEVATDCVVDALRPATDADWSVPAGSLEWSCRDTAQHIGQAHLHWASQLVVGARTQYVRWSARPQELAPPAGVLDFVEAAGRILACVVRASPAETRAFHPYGYGDPEGFAGMGCVEMLLHGQDLATGLACSLEPPAGVCERVLTRLFPHEPRVADDAWLELRRVTGRAVVPGAPARDSWKWRSTPLNEPWDGSPTPEPMPFVPLTERQSNG
ncbi:maleylpyruvate isomerase N-terminal domain-containing protein [Kribbella sp. NPDC004875]|uniref:maleylpyruvate isomerase N-terminal domain-containing protein n=1 Tax=Kribbella sp. NPDC004875 TaxID=3364107 RepID=UPI0036A52AE6